MSEGTRTILPVTVRDAFAALEDDRFIAMCAGEVALGSPRADGALRGNLTHVEGEAQMDYQFTMRVLEACVDSHHVRYELVAREERGGSLAALTMDAALSVVDAQTTLDVQPHLVLAGSHGGIPYVDLERASTKAVQVLSTRIAGLLSEPGVLEALAHPSEAERELGGVRELALPEWARAFNTAPTKEAVLATTAVGVLCVAAYVFIRRSRSSS